VLEAEPRRAAEDAEDTTHAARTHLITLVKLG